MNIVIPFEGCALAFAPLTFWRSVWRSTSTRSPGDTFQMTASPWSKLGILPDSVKITEGQELTDDILRRQMSIEQFISVTAEEALPNVLGLLLRIAVADGRLTDARRIALREARIGGSSSAAGHRCTSGNIRRIPVAMHSGTLHRGIWP